MAAASEGGGGIRYESTRNSYSAVPGCIKSVNVRRLSRDSVKDPPATAPTNLPPPRIDYKAIADDVLFKSHNAFNRKAPVPVGTIQSAARLYAEVKSLSSELNRKLALRNKASDLVRAGPAPGDSTTTAAGHGTHIQQAKALKSEISALKSRLANMEDELLSKALLIPNDTHPDTPIGPEAAAVTLSTHGPDPLPATPLRDHVRVARALEMLDLEAGSTVTGSSWYYLTDDGAMLELALTNYAVSVAMKHGYAPVVAPDVVRADMAVRCGFQPRDPADDGVQQMYHLAASPGRKSHPELVLSGTAEIPLAGLFANKVFDESQLPRKVVGIGKAFRAEAGARGADTRGLYRVHQFTKVELFAVASAADSESLMEDMRATQLDILEGLGLPLRLLDMPTEELGASAYRKYDIEAWMPGRGRWGEVTSASNCTDYQSRRLHIRYRRAADPQLRQNAHHSHAEKQPLEYAHTLNGTAAAIPRLIVALLENGVRLQGDGQEVDGLSLPRVLSPFWLGTAKDAPGRSDINWV